MQLEASNSSQNNANSDFSLSIIVDIPKLPMFKEGDDITSYLIRFERIAQLLGISENTYAVRLGILLTDRAVEIFAALSPEDTADYLKLKKGLFDGFGKTADSYRMEYRTAKPNPDNTLEQYALRLGRLLDYWLKAAEIQ